MINDLIARTVGLRNVPNEKVIKITRSDEPCLQFMNESMLYGL